MSKLTSSKDSPCLTSFVGYVLSRWAERVLNFVRVDRLAGRSGSAKRCVMH
jgi:hypothetical protein